MKLKYKNLYVAYWSFTVYISKIKYENINIKICELLKYWTLNMKILYGASNMKLYSLNLKIENLEVVLWSMFEVSMSCTLF